MQEIHQTPHETKEALLELINLRKNHITPFEEDGKTITPKIVWKYDGFIHTLLYRVIDIASATVDLWEKKRAIPAIVLARSLMETIAVAYWLISNAKNKLTEHNLAELDKMVTDLMFSAKISQDFPQARSVMTYIDSVDKWLAQFRKSYEILCEISHPNNMGTTYAYSQTDYTNYEIILSDSNPKSDALLSANMPSALSGSIAIMKLTYMNYCSLRPSLLELAQREWEIQTKNKDLNQ